MRESVKIETEEKLKERAAKVEALIGGCHTDQRGDLLVAVADILHSRAQSFTASILRDAGHLYGVSK